MEEETTKPHILRKAWTYIGDIGWYIVGIIAILCYLWPYIQEKYNTWKSKKDEREYEEKYHKDPDIILDRLSKIELTRQHMQEQYNRDLELAKQKEAEKKEKKKQQLLKLTEKLDGNRLGTEKENSSGASTSTSRLLKTEYNPLMGDSGQRYRPPKRTCCGKGGCG